MGSELVHSCAFDHHKPTSWVFGEDVNAPALGVCRCGQYVWTRVDRVTLADRESQELERQRRGLPQ